MPKINVYLPESLADAVRDAQLPVSAICQAALERAVRDVESARNAVVAPLGGTGLLSRFTDRARHVLAVAEASARGVPHDEVDTEHLLLALLDEQGNLALTVLGALDVDPADVRTELLASFPRPAAKALQGHIPFSRTSKRVLELTAKEAITLGHNYIGCEHLLVGLLAAEDAIASTVLRRMGLELRTTRRAVASALAGLMRGMQMDPPTASMPPSSSRATDETLAEILRRLDALEQRIA